MAENKEETLLNPEKPLTLDMAQRFMEKYANYFEVKRNLTPTGNMVAPTSKVLPTQITSGRD